MAFGSWTSYAKVDPGDEIASVRAGVRAGVRAVFVDRDGVINENRADYVKCWAEFRFIAGALDALARLTRAGANIFIVTNQAAVNRGIVSSETMDEIHHRMVEEIERGGGRIVDTAYCPHRPDESCECRKPRPGLLLNLADKHGIDLHNSILIGDTISDLKAAEAAGCHPMFVLTGHGQEQFVLLGDPRRYPVVTDLSGAVDYLLRSDAFAS